LERGQLGGRERETVRNPGNANRDRKEGSRFSKTLSRNREQDFLTHGVLGAQGQLMIANENMDSVMDYLTHFFFFFASSLS
jgi:hypothetical protein